MQNRLVLVALVVLAAGSFGCQHARRGCFRGATCNPGFGSTLGAPISVPSFAPLSSSSIIPGSTGCNSCAPAQSFAPSQNFVPGPVYEGTAITSQGSPACANCTQGADGGGQTFQYDSYVAPPPAVQPPPQF